MVVDFQGEFQSHIFSKCQVKHNLSSTLMVVVSGFSGFTLFFSSIGEDEFPMFDANMFHVGGK